MEGKVKWFDAAKGYGFIEGNDGQDYFVHFSEIRKAGYKSLEEDEAVSFDVGTGKDGRKQATDVTPLEPNRRAA